MSRRLCKHFYLLLIVNSLVSVCADDYVPSFERLEIIELQNDVEESNNHKVLFRVDGKHLKKSLSIRTTNFPGDKGKRCKNIQIFNVSELLLCEPNVSSVVNTTGLYSISIPRDFKDNLYICLPVDKNLENQRGIPKTVFDSEFYTWIHQGNEIVINQTTISNIRFDLSNRQINSNKIQRGRRDGVDSVGATGGPTSSTIKLYGFRVEKPYKELHIKNGIPQLLANAPEKLRLYGEHFRKDMTVTFTTEQLEFNEICQLPIVRGFSVDNDTFTSSTASLTVKLPSMPSDASSLYFCIKAGNYTSNATFLHQGHEPWLEIVSYDKMIPIWAAISLILICLCFSALFSGLNLGLMSLDRTELKILCNTGTENERKYAKIITPVRSHGNYLLCSILLGNVFVNSIFTILLDDLTSGTIAVIFSTLAIVLVGEITPQAICSRHGLAIGAKTIIMTKFVMLLTFPLSYPVSIFLDWLLGEEIGNIYNRERLKELLKVTTGANDLDKDEVNIISGALELRKKTVADVMTKIEDVFMLDYEAVLDFETVSEIMKSGFSRVPVFEGNRQNIVTMLYIKDLAFVDPDDNTPLKTLCQFYQNPCNFVFEDVTLDIMFKIFKEGNKGHMAFVHRVNNEGEGDPFYETVGLITLEDVIEELIQAEIMDETDVFTDNRSKRKRSADRTKQDFSMFAERPGIANRIRISPQLTLATFQYLSTSVEPFQPNVISETILRRLLKQDIVCHIKKNKSWRTDPANVIYQQGKAADYFVLILEGRVEVTVGKESLNFEGGPFTYFGTQALVQCIGVAESPSVPTPTLGSLESINLDALLRHSFQPDYTVRACTEVLYLHVKRSLYLAAKRATLMEKSQKDNNQTAEQFDEEVDKLLHGLDEEAASTGHTTPRKSSKNVIQHPELFEGVVMSRTMSPKTPSIYSNVSPPSQHHNQTPKDINNGSVKLSSIDVHEELSDRREEEVSLLPKRGS